MLLCMRTTMDLADELLRQARRRAVDEGTSLKDVVERALRAFLRGGRSGGRKPYEFRWKTFSSEVREGIDFEDWGRVRDLMDGID